MGLQFPLVALPLALTCLICAVTAALIQRNTIGSESSATLKTANKAQMAVMMFISLWSFGQLVAVTSTSKELKTAGLYLTLSVTLWTAAAWFLFAAMYTGRARWSTRRMVAAASILPVIGTLLVVTDPLHGQVLRNPELVREGSRALLRFEWGIGAWLVAVHDWLVCSIALGFLYRKFLRSRNVYRKISFFHLVGGLVLMVSAFVSLIGHSPFPYLVLGVATFSTVIAISAPTVVSYRYLKLIPLERILSKLGGRWQNLTPMARDTIVQTLNSGVIVLDHDNRIVDVNPLGRRIVGAESQRVVGERLQDVLPPSLFQDEGDLAVLDPETTDDEFHGVWVETPTGEDRCFDIIVTGLGDSDEPAGRVALITDVTDRELRKEKLEQRTRELERQNDQLEDFAGIVSHDLRNPLNVARGHLQIARDTGDTSAIEEAETSLDRMEAIIEDVLTLARQGQSIGETEFVGLGDVAREAWSNVDTPDAVLDVLTEVEIEADPDRLLNLFENLYRNARDHAGPDVTVTVGFDEGLFYVADDGPGIPEDRRDEVFESGHTTDEDGTGFGLAIVSQVAEAHGWDVSLTDSDTGGARFEFRGIELRGERVPQ